MGNLEHKIPSSRPTSGLLEQSTTSGSPLLLGAITSCSGVNMRTDITSGLWAQRRCYITSGLPGYVCPAAASSFRVTYVTVRLSAVWVTYGLSGRGSSYGLRVEPSVCWGGYVGVGTPTCYFPLLLSLTFSSLHSLYTLLYSSITTLPFSKVSFMGVYPEDLPQ